MKMRSAYAEYNYYKMKDRFKDIENTFSGLKTPIGRFVCGENGLATDEKIQELADRVIFSQTYVYIYNVGISGILRRYYELLFYLILRTHDPYDTVFDFANFLSIAKELSREYICREELVLRDAGRLGGLGGFFAKIQNSCVLLNGRSLADGMTVEELDNMEASFVQKRDIYRKKKSKWEKKKAEWEDIFKPSGEERGAVIEKYQAYELEGEGEYDYYTALEKERYEKDMTMNYYYDTLPQEKRAYKTQEEIKEIWDKEPETREKWLQSFEDPEKYLNSYREFSELNWCVDVFAGEHNLEWSLSSILETEKLNKFGDNEKFLRLYAELNKALRVARSRL